MPLFTINADLASLTAAVADLARAVREAAGIRAPKGAPTAKGEPTGSVDYCGNELLIEQHIAKAMAELRNQPAEVQREVLSYLGYGDNQ